MKNSLLVFEIKKIHIENGLRALDSNRNFLLLNKISVETLVSLLIDYYHYERSEEGAKVINNILQNYFNRNNILAVEFFEREENVGVLLRIWENFHHMLRIDRKATFPKLASLSPNARERGGMVVKSASLGFAGRTAVELAVLKDRDAKIDDLRSQIDVQDRAIERLKGELLGITNEGRRSGKRVPSHQIQLVDDDDEISILQLDESRKSGEKSLVYRNCKPDFHYDFQKSEGRGKQTKLNL
jgi:hypothetical protein